MRRRRKFYRGVVNHVYQRTVNWVNIFYCYEDFLVFYTIYAVCAKSADVVTLEMCLMYDHTHILIRAESIQVLSAFVDRFSAWFVHEFNNSIGRKGKLLHKNFGSAPKWGEKATRSAINYVGNNPTEKGLCSDVKDYRWNFLAYAVSDHPFSEKIILSQASLPLRNALKEADRMAALNLPLKYVHLRRMMKKLSEKEIEQFVDYVIKSYCPFDYNEMISYYGSYDNMIAAMNSNTGSEHDIREARDKFSHKVISEILEELSKHMQRTDIRRLIMLPEDKKRELAGWISKRFPASHWQICKFLHLSPDPNLSAE